MTIVNIEQQSNDSTTLKDCLYQPLSLCRKTLLNFLHTHKVTPTRRIESSGNEVRRSRLENCINTRTLRSVCVCNNILLGSWCTQKPKSNEKNGTRKRKGTPSIVTPRLRLSISKRNRECLLRETRTVRAAARHRICFEQLFAILRFLVRVLCLWTKNNRYQVTESFVSFSVCVSFLINQLIFW